MKVIKYEVRKLLQCKLTIILVVAILIFGVIYPISLCISEKNDLEQEELSINKINHFYKENEKNITDENSLYSCLSKIKGGEDTEPIFNSIEQQMCNYYDTRSLRNTGHSEISMEPQLEEKKNEYISVEHINKKLNELEQSNRVQEELYKSLTRAKKKLEAVGSPKLTTTYYLENYDKYEVVTVLICSFILIFLFVRGIEFEHDCNMQSMLLSSIYGRKKLWKYRVLSSITIVGGIVIFINICSSIIFLLWGSKEGIECNLNSLTKEYAYCPYKISIGQYFICKMVCQILSVEALIMLVIYLAQKLKNGMISVVLGGAFVLSGYAMSIYGIYFGPASFSIYHGINPQFIYGKFHEIRLFGVYIDYPIAYVGILIMINIILCLLLRHNLSKGEA